MRIHALYEKYNLMPQLREHQLRVGGIVRLMTEDHDCIITALVHDMGNIVKFDLSNPLLPISNIIKWRSEQKQVRLRYGTEAHQATYAILNEAGLTKYVLYLQAEAEAYVRTNNEMKFFAAMPRPALFTLYADLRVGPTGVVTMAERITDLEKRYGMNRAERQWGETLENYMERISAVSPASITEADVRPLFDELLTMTV